MQIDSHMHFMKNWDTKSIAMLQATATQSSSKTSPFSVKRAKKKSVLTYLPYTDVEKLRVVTSSSKGGQEQEAMEALPKICGGYFSNGPKDSQMINLRTTSLVNSTSSLSSRPINVPFVVVGNFITTSGTLNEYSYLSTRVKSILVLSLTLPFL